MSLDSVLIRVTEPEVRTATAGALALPGKAAMSQPPNRQTPWLEVFRCSVCDEVFSSWKSCQQHCSQPKSRCNMGRDRSASPFATVIRVQVRVDNRVVGGGQVRVSPGAGHAHEDQEASESDEGIYDSGGPSEHSGNVPRPGAPRRRYLTISKIVLQYLAISKGCTL